MGERIVMRRNPTLLRARRGETPALRERLRDESGIALVMALGIMLALTIALTSVVAFTSAAGRDAHRTTAGQKAYAVAEAGVNNALAVLYANYPSDPGSPGDPALLTPARTTPYEGGSCAAPVNNCATWSGTLVGPLATTSPWRWEWRITSVGAVRNPTGPTVPVTRRVTAVVPVVIPPTTVANPSGPLNFLYSGLDMWFLNSVHVKAPVYVLGDLHLESTSNIDGLAEKVAVGTNGSLAGGNLYLKNPQNQIGLTGGTDPRLPEIHVVNKCSSKANPTLHTCGPLTAAWDVDAVFATVADNTIPAGFIAYTPQLTCCAPYGGAISPPAPPPVPPATTSVSNMGFWYQNADLGPLSPCTNSTGTPPIFDTASGVPDNSINWSATPVNAINLTPATSYTCQVKAGTTILGELSWNQSTQVLKVKGTVFIDGSIYISPSSGSGRYAVDPDADGHGVAAIVVSGTFGMKNSRMCATHPGYTGLCDLTATTPWDPNKAALVIVSDGSAGGPGAQGQGSDFNVGEAIELKSSDFQGGLIANKSIRAETTSQMQGPMVSAYNGVFAGQSNDLIFPPINFAPSGGGGIVSEPPKFNLLPPRQFAGG